MFYIPVVTIAGNHAGFVVFDVDGAQVAAQFVGIIVDSEVKIQLAQVYVNRLSDLQHLVEELDVLVAAVTPELRMEHGFFVHGHFTVHLSRPLLDLPDGADVFGRDPLVLIDQENCKTRRANALLDLILAVPVAVHFGDKPVRLVHDQAVIEIRRHIAKAKR